ncbi:MAG TPA: ATP-binding protein [Roseiflexaceae bacterium]|nr:ATP-binding protein [Roseiflexaceae bacterium]
MDLYRAMDTMGMSKVSSIRVAADVEQLATIRAFVEQQAQLLGVDPSASYDLVLAANEMATNIVVHGYRGRPGTIDIELRQFGDAIEIRLRDNAPPFDPTRAPAPDLTLPLHKRPFGGMGIHVTRQMMDDIRHRATTQGGNELTLVKRGIVAPSRKE